MIKRKEERNLSTTIAVHLRRPTHYDFLRIIYFLKTYPQLLYHESACQYQHHSTHPYNRTRNSPTTDLYNTKENGTINKFTNEYERIRITRADDHKAQAE